MRHLAILFILCLTTEAIALDAFQDFYEQMRFLSARDKMLSENIANGDTPGYKPKELIKQKKGNTFRLSRTNSMHLDIDADSGNYSTINSEFDEIKPNGNAVNLERELFKKNENAVHLQEVMNVYNKARSMVKTAAVGVK